MFSLKTRLLGALLVAGAIGAVTLVKLLEELDEANRKKKEELKRAKKKTVEESINEMKEDILRNINDFANAMNHIGEQAKWEDFRTIVEATAKSAVEENPDIANIRQVVVDMLDSHSKEINNMIEKMNDALSEEKTNAVLNSLSDKIQSLFKQFVPEENVTKRHPQKVTEDDEDMEENLTALKEMKEAYIGVYKDLFHREPDDSFKNLEPQEMDEALTKAIEEYKKQEEAKQEQKEEPEANSAGEPVSEKPTQEIPAEEPKEDIKEEPKTEPEEISKNETEEKPEEKHDEVVNDKPREESKEETVPEKKNAREAIAEIIQKAKSANDKIIVVNLSSSDKYDGLTDQAKIGKEIVVEKDEDIKPIGKRKVTVFKVKNHETKDALKKCIENNIDKSGARKTDIYVITNGKKKSDIAKELDELSIMYPDNVRFYSIVG